MDEHPTLVRGGPEGPPPIDGRYAVVRPLGEGGFGRVLLVEDAFQDRELVAIKIIHARHLRTRELQARFRTEIRVLRELRSPGVPRILNDGRTAEGESYFTMEFVDGPTLDRLISGEGRLEPARTIRLLEDVLAVLAEAHARHIVHRDLKPANVIVRGAGTEDERPVLLDFGIAKVLRREDEPRAPTAALTRARLGTPAYMAPEQERGEPVDERTDVFALGVMAFRMLTGKCPRRGASGEWVAAELARSLGAKGVQAPRLARLVPAMMSFEPGERPSLPEIRRQLERRPRPRARVLLPIAVAALAGLAISRRPSTAPEESVPPERPPAPIAGEPAPPVVASEERAASTQSVGAPLWSPPREPQDGTATEPEPAPTGQTVARGPAEPGRIEPGRVVPGRIEPARVVPAPAESGAPTGVELPDRFEAAPGAALHASGWPEEIVHLRTGMQLVLVPAGSYEMGSPAWDRSRADHITAPVDVPEPFYVGRHEVTRGQFTDFCRATDRDAPPAPPWEHDDDHPIVFVSWEDARTFAEWAGLELPTEALWEYAARAGVGERFPWGDSCDAGGAAPANVFDETARERRPHQSVRWFPFADRFPETAPVGTFDANAWGLHDVVGNVAEWCANSYEVGPDPSIRIVDRGAPGDRRVVRGGSWSSEPDSAYLSSRSAWGPAGRQGFIGFRCIWRPGGGG